MNRGSVSHADSRPEGASRLRPAVQAREAGLELIRRINRWLIAAVVAAAGALSLLAAHAFHGRAITAGGASSSSTASRSSSSSWGVPSSSSSNAGGSGLQAPAQTPTPAQAAPAPVVSGGS